MNKEPSTAQKLVGDIAPKLADLTGTVLLAMCGNARNCRSEIGVL